ncbi:UDP pyrophosphate phosphatase [Streptomyces cavourensis]|nr:UDP pyrophosphate phosphatase [Streptomyces cavourensis]MBT3077560.1 UDP pyrophosphate phosphatase [Streptomyces sp. COG21]MBT3084404.1 UDP pyrophosphate phosphatase [Streptomyces sp. COG20]MBT3086976.1 UDP pyrophosphate phosphatase [Streptomyces sp. CYG21]MBT3098730.1 UDP pyrophosphate phosphatase [Streptomyces sp. CBG30]MBT3103645.1 UDP pyrophosphate phosphatase [Streptomyces sp. COG19]MBT3111334.1 UDP pyrophosphate phosphatase [Streptomyces sp. CYG20]
MDEAAGSCGGEAQLTAWFMKFITTKSFMPFVIYRVALGILIFILVSAGVLSPHAGESAG